VKIVISSDWRKTLPEKLLAQAIGQDEVEKTPYTHRNITDVSALAPWFREAINKKKLRIKQIEAFC
jgi:hypothetical protein